MLSAQSVGATFWPVFMQYLFLQYSWQGALLIIVGVHTHILIAMVLIPSMCGKVSSQKACKESYDCEVNDETNISECQVDKMENSLQSGVQTNKPALGKKTCLHPEQRSLLIHLLGILLNSYGYITILSFIPSLATEFGLTKLHASFLVSSVAVCGILVRPLMGWLSGKKAEMLCFCTIYVT